MFVIRNNEGKFWSSRIYGEWNEGWGNDAEIFRSYDDAMKEVMTIPGYRLFWIYEVILHTA